MTRKQHKLKAVPTKEVIDDCINKDLVELNRRYLLLARAVANVSPEQARRKLGIHDDFLELLVDMTMGEIDRLSKTSALMFTPRITKTQLKKIVDLIRDTREIGGDKIFLEAALAANNNQR